jgi:RNA polymerase sigma-70 factor (ECF subfamily)
VTNQVLARARAGEEDAFRELTDPYRRELQVHIYRIVGSVHDAEDLLQETLLAAWRGLEGFEGRASVRAWLYRIATNRALDALRATRRRPEDLQRMTEMPEPTRYGEAIWLEPFPDVLLEGIADQAPGPEARYETKEAIELGFIVGLQHLSPSQRAVLVLRDVLGYRAEEVAEMLDTTAQSVNSLLRRARAAFESRLPAVERERAPLPDSKRERDTIGRFADAIQTGDIDGVVALLTDEAWLTRHAAAGTDPRQHPTSIRRLLPNPPDRDRPTVRNGRPDPRGPADLRDHLVWRQRLPALRAAADTPIGKRSPARLSYSAPRGARRPRSRATADTRSGGAQSGVEVGVLAVVMSAARTRLRRGDP